MLGAALASPAVWLTWFVAVSYSVGFGVDVGWLIAIALSFLVGCALMIWSLIRMCRAIGGVGTGVIAGVLLAVLAGIAIWIVPQFFAVTFIVGGNR